MKRRAYWSQAQLAALLVTFALAPLGCEDEKPKSAPTDAGAEDSGANQALLGGRLGAAVAAVEGTGSPTASPRSTAAQAAGAEGGPPENGILGPSGADKAHPRGAPPKIELFSEGAEPKTGLAPKIEAGAEQKLVLSLVLRSQGVLTINLAVTFKVEKPKDEKKADAAPAAGAAPSPAPAPSGLMIVGKVTSADAGQGAPEDLAKAIGKLKGSRLLSSIGPDGAPGAFTHELAKGGEKGTEAVLTATTEMLALLVAPMPAKPVGIGGYWMVTDRGAASGSDMVRYRVFRVTSIDKTETKMSIELRQYAAETSVRVAGGPQGEVALTLDRFESRGKGEVTAVPKGFLPSGGEITSQTQALVIAPGQQGNQRAQVQTEVRLRILPAP